MPPPDRLLLPLTLAGESTFVVAVALLLPGVPSAVLEVTVAVLLIIEPAGTFGATATLRVNTVLPTANEGFVHETVPVPPDSSGVQDHPLSLAKLTKVVPAGSVSLHEALAAVSGPLLVTVIV